MNPSGPSFLQFYSDSAATLDVFIPLLVVLLLAIPFSILAMRSETGRFVFVCFCLAIPMIMVASYLLQRPCGLCHGSNLSHLHFSVLN